MASSVFVNILGVLVLAFDSPLPLDLPLRVPRSPRTAADNGQHREPGLVPAPHPLARAHARAHMTIIHAGHLSDCMYDV